MSSHYTTEPPPTASVLIHTTAGQLTVSLFAQQTPLTCRNFLQHVIDESYANNVFHRVSPGFVIQTGDPTGTGEGGTNIYEDRDFERYDEDWARVMGREVGEKISFGDEVHSRLKFNRRGLVGMAKGTDGAGYGSQFFITLGDCRAELDRKCTMFGRIEGDGIYNVVKVAEGQLVEGTERPMYPEKILKVEVLEMPKGDAWANMRKRQRVAERTFEAPAKKKAPKKKGGKTLLSFGGDDGEDEEVAVRPKKAKFNPNLIDSTEFPEAASKTNGTTKSKPARREEALAPMVPSKRKSRSPSPMIPSRRKASPPPRESPSPKPRRRAPSFHDPNTQLPLNDPESTSRSPTPPPKSKTSSLQAEIAALKASMRRTVDAPVESKHKKSALEALIPATSTRGRKRPRPGETSAKDEASALRMLNAFKARLETVDHSAKEATNTIEDGHAEDEKPVPAPAVEAADDEEAMLCDLHFIANCQSCSNWDKEDVPKNENDDDADQWMSHSLSFAKDRLGKDLTWKRKNEEELVVIDPREKEKELKEERKKDREKGKGRDKRW